MTKRVWSEKLAKGADLVVLMNRPVHPEEHMIHAWSALDAASRGDNVDAHMAYARRRLADADHMLATYPERRIKHRRAFDAELAELRAALS